MPWKGTSSLLSSLPITNSGSSWTPALVMKGAECKRFGWDLFSLHLLTLHPVVSMATGACFIVSCVEGLYLILVPCQESLVTCPFLPSHLIGLDPEPVSSLSRWRAETNARDHCLRSWTVGPPGDTGDWVQRHLARLWKIRNWATGPFPALTWLPGLAGFWGPRDEKITWTLSILILLQEVWFVRQLVNCQRELLAWAWNNCCLWYLSTSHLTNLRVGCLLSVHGVSQVALVVKNPLAMQRHKKYAFKTWIGKIPWRKAWQPTPVFWPGESHRRRSLMGSGP